MKRSKNQSMIDCTHVKKVKISDVHQEVSNSIVHCKFSDLTRDELSIVLEYLPIGSVIMYALTSKANYEFTCDQVKNYICKYYVMNENCWSVKAALRQKTALKLFGSNIDLLEKFIREIIARKGSISEITNNLIGDCGVSFETLYKLLNFRKGSEKIQVETIRIRKDKEIEHDNETKYEKIIKTIEGEPIGYDLKELSLSLEISKYECYKIMTKMKNLENLHVDVDPLFTKTSGKQTNDEIKEDGFDDEYVYIPIMRKLKKLVIELFENDQFIYDILPCCPNLEHLDVVCQERSMYCDEFFNFLSIHCPKLKFLKIFTEDSWSQFGEMFLVKITDEGFGKFLEKETQIECIDIEPPAYFSGSIFKRLGDFPTLKSFRNAGVWYYATGEDDQEKEIFFGGKPNLQLEFIDICSSFKHASMESLKKLINSLKKFAPNLKSLGDIGIVFDDQELARFPKILLENYFDTLEIIEVNLSNYSLVHLCNSLKRVIIDEDLSYIEEKLKPNLNVTELEIIKPTCFKESAEMFPNIKIIETQHGELVDFILNNPTCWPNLVHLKISFNSVDDELYDGLSRQRPHLFIEIEGAETANVTPQIFYYQWLQRDMEERLASKRN